MFISAVNLKSYCRKVTYLFIVCRETEEVADTEKIIDSEKQEEAADTNKENTAEVAEEEEPEKEVCEITCLSWFVIIRYVDVILFYRESLLELFLLFVQKWI